MRPLLTILCIYAHTAHCAPTKAPEPSRKTYCEWQRCEVDDQGNRTECRPHKGIVDADSFADRIYIPGLLGQVPRYECRPLEKEKK